MPNQETRKVSKIVSALIHYLLRRGFSRVNISVHKKNSTTHIRLEIPNVKAEDMKEMIEKIAKEKDTEIEMYGWELIGEAGYKDELIVLGMLIDHVEVEEKNEALILHFTRIRTSDQH